MVALGFYQWIYGISQSQTATEQRGMRQHQDAWRATYEDRDLPCSVGPREGFWGERVNPKVPHPDISWHNRKVAMDGLFEFNEHGHQHYSTSGDAKYQIMILGASVAAGAPKFLRPGVSGTQICYPRGGRSTHFAPVGPCIFQPDKYRPFEKTRSSGRSTGLRLWDRMLMPKRLQTSAPRLIRLLLEIGRLLLLDVRPVIMRIAISTQPNTVKSHQGKHTCSGTKF